MSLLPEARCFAAESRPSYSGKVKRGSRVRNFRPNGLDPPNGRKDESGLLDNPLVINRVTFEVNDTACGHCASSITRAVRTIDQGAQVTVDLATHRVRIELTESNSAGLSDAIGGSGCTLWSVDDVTAPAEQSAPRSGCCCR